MNICIVNTFTAIPLATNKVSAASMATPRTPSKLVSLPSHPESGRSESLSMGTRLYIACPPVGPTQSTELAQEGRL